MFFIVNNKRFTEREEDPYEAVTLPQRGFSGHLFGGFPNGHSKQGKLDGLQQGCHVKPVTVPCALTTTPWPSAGAKEGGHTEHTEMNEGWVEWMERPRQRVSHTEEDGPRDTGWRDP